MKPEDLAAITTGAELANVLPYVEAHIRKMQNSVRVRAEKAIREGKLTPDMAYDLWHEVYSAERLLKNLQTQVKIGVSAGETYASEMAK